MNSSSQDVTQTLGPLHEKNAYYMLGLLLAVTFVYLLRIPRSKIPILNPQTSLELTAKNAKRQFVARAGDMARSWFHSHPDEPVRLTADFGEITLLPNRMANEIRNDTRLSFSKWTYSTFHAHLPGFEGFREGARDSNIVQSVIIKDLTKHLNKVTEPLVEETTLAMKTLLTENRDWHEVPLKDTMLRLVARVSSRVFLGPELCRNEEWLRVTREYTVTAFLAADELRMWPYFARYVAHWFLPSCRKTRALVREARRLMDPILDKRQRDKQGGTSQEFDDAIEWFEQNSKGSPYDPVVSQLILSVAAIHTTTDLICKTMTDLTRNPALIEPLREEIISTLREKGWQKSSLQSMKLLDSVIKETQRIAPIGVASMRRVALDNVRLSDDTLIRKGEMLGVDLGNMWDPEVYENPKTWDGYRFLKMRETPQGQHASQLVATGPDHLGFGHGRHACPGRFFAANEVKIVLSHMLLQYDWKFPEGVEPRVRHSGFDIGTDPLVGLSIRRRQEDAPVS